VYSGPASTHRRSRSGEEGIAIAKKSAPDLVFLDIRMGGMSGIETLQHLRAVHPQLLVVLMTASAPRRRRSRG
jgi:two-component system nitrogen regulation response regulator GlnG